MKNGKLIMKNEEKRGIKGDEIFMPKLAFLIIY